MFSQYLFPVSGKDLQVQGLIQDIPSCAELVSRIVREAEAIIRGRLEGMIVHPQREAAE